MGQLSLTVDLDNLTEKEKEEFFELIEKSKKKLFNPFKRVKEDETYYYINYYNEIRASLDCREASDKESFDVCNYFNDKEFAEHQALRELLNRKLIKFSYENGGADIKHLPEGYTICIEYSKNANENSDKLKIGVNYCMTDIFAPVFVSGEIAERAIDKVVKPFLEEHPDFKWWG